MMTTPPRGREETLSWLSCSREETLAIGQQLGQALLPGAVVCFYGDLAAGKTTLIKGLAAAAGCSEDDIHSPTFVYLHIYSGRQQVFHFDLYRLGDPDEFCAMGFDEYLSAGGIACIEWAERIEHILPPQRLEVYIEHHLEGRSIQIKACGGMTWPKNK